MIFPILTSVAPFPADGPTTSVAPSVPRGAGVFSMRIVCAWCKREMGRKPCPEHQHDLITGTICSSCFERVEADANFSGV